MRKLVLSVLFVSGCGISNGTLLVDLEPEDAKKLCEKEEPETFTCEEGGFSLEFTIGGGDCSDNFAVTDDCEATVGDWRDCNDATREALAKDPCAELPAECDWFGPCIGLGT